MSTPLQKLIYTTIGCISITNEKFKELLEDLIQNSAYTEDEGKRITDEFLYVLRQQTDHISNNLQIKLDELLNKVGISSILNLKEEVEQYVRDVKENPIHLLNLPKKK